MRRKKILGLFLILNILNIINLLIPAQNCDLENYIENENFSIFGGQDGVNNFLFNNTM